MKDIENPNRRFTLRVSVTGTREEEREQNFDEEKVGSEKIRPSKGMGRVKSLILYHT